MIGSIGISISILRKQEHSKTVGISSDRETFIFSSVAVLGLSSAALSGRCGTLSRGLMHFFVSQFGGFLQGKKMRVNVDKLTIRNIKAMTY